jgi:hypothetical protein
LYYLDSSTNIPDKVYFWQNSIIDFFKLSYRRIIKKKNLIRSNEETKVDKIIKRIKLKHVVYVLSIMMTVLDSLEKIANQILINNSIWIQIKPVIFQTIITVLVRK